MIPLDAPTATSGETRVLLVDSVTGFAQVFEHSMVEIRVRMRELFDHLARAFGDVKDSLDEFFDAIKKVKPRGYGLFGSVRFSSDRSDESLRVARVLPSRRPWKCVAMPREPRRSLASGWHPERPRR